MAGQKPKLRKREIALALGAGALAAGGVAIAIDDDDGDRDVRVEYSEDHDEIIKTRFDAADFDEISASGPYDIVITQGEEFTVVAEGPRWVLDQLEASVSEGRLLIEPVSDDSLGNWSDGADVTFHITMPAISRLSSEGAGDIAIDRISGESFEGFVSGASEMTIGSIEVEEVSFRISGAGGIEAAGSATRAEIAITGAGEVDAAGLRSQTASVSISGLGEIDLTVDDEADITVTGAGEVDIFGSATCSVSQSGLAEVSCEGADPS